MRIHPITLWENKTSALQIKMFCEMYNMRLHIKDDGSFVLVHEEVPYEDDKESNT